MSEKGQPRRAAWACLVGMSGPDHPTPAAGAKGGGQVREQLWEPRGRRGALPALRFLTCFSPPVPLALPALPNCIPVLSSLDALPS